ncbi:MAG: Spy/CpxP family protein refolding chaperone [Silvanigrellales bacterium]|nr:Spy/CpxP family protein refolding chaperone [Silvanigrellales bacterium]
MKKFGRLFAFLSFGAVALGAVGCHARGGTPEAREAWVSEKIAHRLELDDAQKTKLGAVKAELTEAMKEFQGVRDAGRSTLRQELGKETMDAAKLTAAIQAHLDVVTRRAPAVVAALVELHASLRPDQRDEVKVFAEKHLSEEGHRGRGGRFFRGGSHEKKDETKDSD